MDEKEHDLRNSHEVAGRVDQRMTETSGGSVDNPVVETITMANRDEAGCLGGENKDLEAMGCELGSNKVPGEEGLGEVSGGSEQARNGDSTNPVVGVVFETIVVINTAEAPLVGGESRGFNAKVSELGSPKVSVEESKKIVSGADKQSCVIDVNCGNGKGYGDKWDGEKICRICHLNSDQSPDRTTTTTTTTVNSTVDLIHLGCGCKDELGVAHHHCAEAWFRLKGNRLCEICGETAKNITGVGDSRFMDEWNERTFTGSGINSSGNSGGCWRGQPFCNFLMACLVIAFVLPWFFRVNMF